MCSISHLNRCFPSRWRSHTYPCSLSMPFFQSILFIAFDNAAMSLFIANMLIDRFIPLGPTVMLAISFLVLDPLSVLDPIFVHPPSVRGSASATSNNYDIYIILNMRGRSIRKNCCHYWHMSVHVLYFLDYIRDAYNICSRVGMPALTVSMPVRFRCSSLACVRSVLFRGGYGNQHFCGRNYR